MIFAPQVWYGEFGWEVMTWAPICRAQADGRPTLIRSFAGMAALYDDFAEFQAHEADPIYGRGLEYPKHYRHRGTHRRYGKATKPSRVLLHARGAKLRKAPTVNYRSWSEIQIPGSATIGSPGDQLVPGTEDLRGIPLDELMDHLASAEVVVGVSSGVLHLAAACGAPLVVWGCGDKTFFGETLEKRYKETWNPHAAPVHWIRADDWQPAPEKILEAIEDAIGTGQGDREGQESGQLARDDHEARSGRDDSPPLVGEEELSGWRRRAVTGAYLAKEPGLAKPDDCERAPERFPSAGVDLNGKKLLLRNGSPLGDSVLFTCLVRDLKATFPGALIKVRSAHRAVFENNPHLSDFPDNEAEYMFSLGPRLVIRGSKWNGLHACDAFPACFEAKTGIQLKPGPQHGDLHLSREELAGPPKGLTKPYWVVVPDCSKAFTTKQWVVERWQELVEATPDIHWVQDGLRPAPIDLQGANVTSLVGQTSERDLIRLIYHAEGFVGLVSGPMHIAGALKKPAVIIAGAREPATYEAYQWHRFLGNVGSLPCCRDSACWAAKLDPVRCKHPLGRLVDGTPECLYNVTVEDVVRGIRSYDLSARPGRAGGSPVLRIVSNGKMLGGAERSVVEIAKMAVEDGWRVELATRSNRLCGPMTKALPRDVRHVTEVSSPCDVLLLYASDMIWDFHKPEFDVFKNLKAKRKVMALTYKLGKAGQIEWTKDWDQYLFLSSALRDAFGKGQVLAPPVDLEPFFAVKPDYSSNILARHSSQGDKKYSSDIQGMIDQCPEDLKFKFMPKPSFLDGDRRVIGYPENHMPVPQFLELSMCFWYLLPEGYTDQGPRAIMEAMAAGLPVIAENRDGARDRIIHDETGWLVDSHQEAVELIRKLMPPDYKQAGRRARERAKQEFRKELWWEAVKG